MRCDGTGSSRPEASFPPRGFAAESLIRTLDCVFWTKQRVCAPPAAPQRLIHHSSADEPTRQSEALPGGVLGGTGSALHLYTRFPLLFAQVQSPLREEHKNSRSARF